MKIEWMGHASFRIETEGKVIYIDPYGVKENKKDADLVLISHEHYDHCDISSIEKIRKSHTSILASEDSADKISRKFKNVGILRPGDVTEFEGIRIIAVHSYNIGKHFHSKGSGVGFVIESENKRVYHAGDSDFIPEMKNLKNITVALLPIGGTYTMNVDDAIKAVKIIKPEIVIPMHYGSIVGSMSDAEKFMERIKTETKARIEILDNNQKNKIEV